MARLNYQKLAASRRAATDNRGVRSGDQKAKRDYRVANPNSTGARKLGWVTGSDTDNKPKKKRKRWSGERRAVAKYGLDKGQFARKHDLACSSCGDKHPADWAVARIGKRGKPFGYCLPCYQVYKAKRQASG